MLCRGRAGVRPGARGPSEARIERQRSSASELFASVGRELGRAGEQTHRMPKRVLGPPAADGRARSSGGEGLRVAGDEDEGGWTAVRGGCCWCWAAGAEDRGGGGSIGWASLGGVRRARDSGCGLVGGDASRWEEGLSGQRSGRERQRERVASRVKGSDARPAVQVPASCRPARAWAGGGCGRGRCWGRAGGRGVGRRGGCGAGGGAGETAGVGVLVEGWRGRAWAGGREVGEGHAVGRRAGGRCHPLGGGGGGWGGRGGAREVCVG